LAEEEADGYPPGAKSHAAGDMFFTGPSVNRLRLTKT